MQWTNKAWEAIQPVYDKIIAMPFIQELKNGTLAMEKFQFYMQQDAKYLEHYGRVLAYIGSKSLQNQQALDFFDFGKNALIVEKALHESYFEIFGLQQDTVITIEPACHHYIHFLKSVAAFDSIEVAISAVLPCFWIYKEVGDYIYHSSDQTSNPYHKWIETYSGEEFAEGVKKAISYTNWAASQTTESTRSQMLEAFIASTNLEFDFWEAAYQLRKW